MRCEKRGREVRQRDTRKDRENEPKETIIFVALELPTIGTVSAKNREVSHGETVSSGKISGFSVFLPVTPWV